MENAVATKEERGLITIEESAMSIESMVKQTALIQELMKRLMKDGEHYGVIPGTQKPTLLKPGAEKLCWRFRYDPQYNIIEKVRERDFIAYTVACTLFHIPTGVRVASGIGSCNSRETKYRYRSENTGKPVPSEYWKNRDSDVLGGRQFSPRKKEGKWVIYEQIENDNPWDLDNTIIKMACKRALIAATLNATAASDIFTQDLEDLPAEIINGESKQEKSTDEPPIPVEQGESVELASSSLPEKKPCSDAQRKKLWAMMKGDKELTDSEAKRFFEWYIAGHGNEVVEVDGRKSLTSRGAHEFIENFDKSFNAFTKA